MKRLRAPSIHLPVVMKELREQAARPRTYQLRALYAAVVYLSAFYAFSDLIEAQRQNSFAVLGQGQSIFASTFRIQVAAIVLFVPALCCGAIADEKQKNTLPLLLLTRLNALEIVLEKLLGRMITVFGYLLVSFPLLGLAYTLGGVGRQDVFLSMALLASLALCTASLSLMTSSYCHSTTAAFAATYLFGFPAAATCGCCLVPAVLPAMPSETFAMVVSVGGLLGLSAFFLMLAAELLWARAFVRPQNHLLAMFRAMDRAYERMNRITGGIELVKERGSLPGTAPVAWREERRRSLGTFRYLFRVLISIELPLLVILVLAVGGGASSLRPLFAWLHVLCWIPSLLLVVTQANALFPVERTHETLPVLLSTPISGAGLLRQKMRGLSRLIFVLQIPFWTIAGFEWFWSFYSPSHEAIYWPRMATELILPGVMLPLAAWLAMLSGLLIKRTMPSLLTVLVAMTGWFLLVWPFAPAFQFIDQTGQAAPIEPGQILSVVSPAAIVLLNEAVNLDPLVIGVHLVVYGGLFVLVREVMLLGAEPLLNRAGV